MAKNPQPEVPKITPQLQRAFLDGWCKQRQMARTDLFFLATVILGYTLLEEKVHRPICDLLQKFQGGKDDVNDAGTQLHYEPACDLWELQGPEGVPMRMWRNTLLLYPRGTFKSTIVTVAHTIQWIINYPDIRIAISTDAGDQAKAFMREIKGHFQWNDNFRAIFPEFCPPPKKASDFGNEEEFTVPCRTRVRKEATVSIVSIGKTVTGMHHDVHKHSDLVTEQNSQTPGGLEGAIHHFNSMEPLLERSDKPPHHGWTDIEGTPYDYADLYQHIRDQEEERPEEERMYRTLIAGARKSDGSALFGSRLPLEELKRIEDKIGTWLYSCNYDCNPVPAKGGLAAREQVRFLSLAKIKEFMPSLRLHVTIDLAGMNPDKTKNDFEVLTLAGFDRDGRMIVLEIRRGHFTPFEVIEHVFDLDEKYPKLVDFKIEKEAHSRVLLPFLRREMSKRGRFPVMVPIQRDTQVSKQSRIRGLQSWFQAGIIVFSESIPCKTDLVNEVMRFPSPRFHDDILDTLADQMQNREGGANADVLPVAKVLPFRHPLQDKFLGFDPLTKGEMWQTDRAVGPWWHEGTGL